MANGRAAELGEMIRSGKEKGFSLIEAMVAMMIISVALLGMGLMTLGVMRSDMTAKLRSVGMNVAEQAIEQWYATNTPPLNTSTYSVNNVVYQLQSFDATPISGVTTSTLPASGSPGTASQVRSITVYWKDSAGVHHVTVTNIEAD